MDPPQFQHGPKHKSPVLTPTEHGFDSDFADLIPVGGETFDYLTDSQPVDEWETYMDEFLLNLACVPDSEALATARELTPAFRAFLRTPDMHPPAGGNDFRNEPPTGKEWRLVGAVKSGAVESEASHSVRGTMSICSTDSGPSSIAAPLVSSGLVETKESVTIREIHLWVDGISIPSILLPPRKRYRPATLGP